MSADPTDAPSPRHANVSRLTDQLWIGGDLETTDDELAVVQLDEIEAMGITDVVDVRLEWNDESWVTEAKPSLGYLWLGVDDAGQQMPDSWFDEGVDHILDRVADGGVVLAHCHMGVNRGPSLGFAALLALGWDAVDALDLIRSQRPIAYVAYAEDAVDWWLRRAGADVATRREARQRVQRWRDENELDLIGVIRRIRLREGA